MFSNAKPQHRCVPQSMLRNLHQEHAERETRLTILFSVAEKIERKVYKYHPPSIFKSSLPAGVVERRTDYFSSISRGKDYGPVRKEVSRMRRHQSLLE